MGLVLNVGDEGKDVAVAVDGNFAALVVHDGTGAVVVVLDHAKGGHMLQRGAAQSLFDRAHLSLTAIDQQQVRQGGKLILGAVRLFRRGGPLRIRRRGGESVSASDA